MCVYMYITYNICVHTYIYIYVVCLYVHIYVLLIDWKRYLTPWRFDLILSSWIIASGYPHRVLWQTLPGDGFDVTTRNHLACQTPRTQTVPFNSWLYTLWQSNIAIENGHRNSEFSHQKMVMFHSYVSLPEGIWLVVTGTSSPPEFWEWSSYSWEIIT